MNRDDMEPLDRAVSDTLDEYLHRFLGTTSSHQWPDAFRDWLAERGYVIVPIEGAGDDSSRAAQVAGVVGRSPAGSSG